MDPRIKNLKSTTFFGRRFTRRQIADIQQTVATFPALSRWHSFKDGIAFVLSGLGEAVNQSAMSGSAGLRSLHFLDGRRDWRG